MRPALDGARDADAAADERRRRQRAAPRDTSRRALTRAPGVVENARSSDGIDHLDLDRLDPPAVVAEQAAAGVELEQAARSARSSRSSPSSASARAASASERIPNTNVAPIRFSSDSRSPTQRVGDELRADDRHRQLGAAHALQRGEQRPPDRVAEQPPALVEGEQLQPLALGAHQVHREHRDQAHDLLAHALGLRVLRARRARLGPGRSRIGR